MENFRNWGPENGTLAQCLHPQIPSAPIFRKGCTLMIRDTLVNLPAPVGVSLVLKRDGCSRGLCTEGLGAQEGFDLGAAVFLVSTESPLCGACSSCSLTRLTVKPSPADNLPCIGTTGMVHVGGSSVFGRNDDATAVGEAATHRA